MGWRPGCGRSGQPGLRRTQCARARPRPTPVEPTALPATSWRAVQPHPCAQPCASPSTPERRSGRVPTQAVQRGSPQGVCRWEGLYSTAGPHSPATRSQVRQSINRLLIVAMTPLSAMLTDVHETCRFHLASWQPALRYPAANRPLAASQFLVQSHIVTERSAGRVGLGQHRISTRRHLRRRVRSDSVFDSRSTPWFDCAQFGVGTTDCRRSGIRARGHASAHCCWVRGLYPQSPLLEPQRIRAWGNQMPNAREHDRLNQPHARSLVWSGAPGEWLRFRSQD